MGELVGHGASQSLIRLTAGESRGHVYFIVADVEKGVVSSLRLSLEKSAHSSGKSRTNFLADFEGRHPACAPILADLASRYGKPRGPEISSEERLESRQYSWSTLSEELVLVCGHYQGRRNVFATDVIVRRVPN
jgi:hypothetical protein